MNVVFTEPFLHNFTKLPEVTKRKFEKQITALLRSIRYPSLHTKKYDAARDIWQARVNGYYRFYFQINAETYTILNIVKHPK